MTNITDPVINFESTKSFNFLPTTMLESFKAKMLKINKPLRPIGILILSLELVPPKYKCSFYFSNKDQV